MAAYFGCCSHPAFMLYRIPSLISCDQCYSFVIPQRIVFKYYNFTLLFQHYFYKPANRIGHQVVRLYGWIKVQLIIILVYQVTRKAIVFFHQQNIPPSFLYRFPAFFNTC